MIKSFLRLSAFFAFAAASFMLHSCNKLANNLRYSLDMHTATADIVIPPYDNTLIMITGRQTVNYNIDSFIKANTANLLGVNNISSARIRSCELVLENPTDAINFANFESCSGYFFTDGNTDPFGVNIAENPDEYAGTLNLPVDTTAELKGYLTNASVFTYNLSGKLRRKTTDSIHCKVKIAFTLNVHG